MIRVVGFQALVFTRYRHDVDYSVFDVNCFPFHVAVPCRMSFQLWLSQLQDLAMGSISSSPTTS